MSEKQPHDDKGNKALSGDPSHQSSRPPPAPHALHQMPPPPRQSRLAAPGHAYGLPALPSLMPVQSLAHATRMPLPQAPGPGQYVTPLNMLMLPNDEDDREDSGNSHDSNSGIHEGHHHHNKRSTKRHHHRSHQHQDDDKDKSDLPSSKRRKNSSSSTPAGGKASKSKPKASADEAAAARRKRHNQIEVRRRQRINEQYDRLKRLLNCLNSNKLTILSGAVEFISAVKERGVVPAQDHTPQAEAAHPSMSDATVAAATAAANAVTSGVPQTASSSTAPKPSNSRNGSGSSGFDSAPQRMASDSGFGSNGNNGNSSDSVERKSASSSSDDRMPQGAPTINWAGARCLVCHKDVDMAFLPCGHAMFCNQCTTLLGSRLRGCAVCATRNSDPMLSLTAPDNVPKPAGTHGCILCEDTKNPLVAFLPCRHYLYCEPCTRRARNCPHCHTQIKERVFVKPGVFGMSATHRVKKRSASASGSGSSGSSSGSESASSPQESLEQQHAQAEKVKARLIKQEADVREREAAAMDEADD